MSTRLGRYPGPVLLAWAPADRFFKLAFVPLDQPQRLADEIGAFVAERQALAGTAAGAGSQSAG